MTRRAEALARQADGLWPADPTVLLAAGDDPVTLASIGFSAPRSARSPARMGLEARDASCADAGRPFPERDQRGAPSQAGPAAYPRRMPFAPLGLVEAGTGCDQCPPDPGSPSSLPLRRRHRLLTDRFPPHDSPAP
jgi:hypothetical protein